MSGNWYQSTGLSPLLQEVVPTPTPTKLPLLPNWPTSGRSPTITSGPGVSVGTPGPAAPLNGGIATDLGTPFTSCVISIGRIVAAIEILPTGDPASAGRPRPSANSFDIKSRPRWILSKRPLAS